MRPAAPAGVHRLELAVAFAIGHRRKPDPEARAAPDALSSSIEPPACSTMPWTTASPSPVPLPTAFVVKNGSNTRASVVGDARAGVA